jgi:endonuclease/exonuclease/phosphatase family metal-dependent hydrolase
MKIKAHLIALLSAVLAVVSCGQVKSLSVMSYNVGAFGKYMEDSTEDIAHLVNSLGADVVALNELDSCNRRHGIYQLEKFAKTLGDWDYAYSSSFPFAGGSYGNGIATRNRILYKEKVLLPMSDGVEQRSLLVVETNDYVLACTHLDHRGRNARVDQARFINSWMIKKYEKSRKPVFLCGDMNSVPEDQTIKEFCKHWTLLSSVNPTYPSSNPVNCIDYIFCLNPKRLRGTVKSEIPASDSIAGYSDHLPVVINFLYLRNR